MAELDFAMLAEYARVDPAGLLTVAGGAFDQIEAPGPGLVQRMALAFRLTFEPDEASTTLEIKINQPGNDSFALGLSSTVSPQVEGRKIVTKPAVVMAVDMGFPVMAAGRYIVQIIVAGQLVKELPFDVRFINGPED
ncbi:DUF6941 family protein [Amycolatopsis orientalis]|uniref:DUF6941 family protein n=1 Tax=Amycolatopsis orientalis TaxID=31958 RepID=UPI00056D52B1|nr:hypothetical protein [Amycolatopsis orientalis]